MHELTMVVRVSGWDPDVDDPHEPALSIIAAENDWRRAHGEEPIVFEGAEWT